MNLRTFTGAALLCLGLAGAALFCLGLAGAALAVPSHDDSFSSDGLLKTDLADLKDTQLVVSPDLPLPANTNMLWCGTLQLAWNEAVNLVGEKLHFSRPSSAADLLNQSAFDRADLDPGSYVAVADFERNHVEDEIRAALQKTFHGAASPELIPNVPPNPLPDDFLAYAYLYKNLAFAHPFADDVDLSFQDQPVKAFGFSAHELDEDTRSQVTICDYLSPDDFVIRIATRSAGDELILAKVKPGTTLAATIATVLGRAAHPSTEYLEQEDSLKVPKLNFDLRRNFGELEGLVLQPTPAAKLKSKLIVSQVEQLVRFQLNEKGAILKSEAVVAMVGAVAGGFEKPPHRLIFNAPFLLLLKQKNAPLPYFALWIGNRTLLIPASQ
jgi:hypothetical protein